MPKATDLEVTVLRLVNEQRYRHGRRPLKTSPRLRMAAQAHAKDMMERNYFAHNTKRGSPWHVRIKRVAGRTFAAIGENIAYGQDDAAEVVAAWMASPEHRKNILSKDFTHMGLGFARRGKTEYWVQDFGGN